MRAAVTPEPMGEIAVREMPDPPRGIGEIIIRVHAASVNRLDRAVYEGTAMGGVARFPLIQGIDAAGRVETGTGPYPEGMRVVVKPTIACNRCRMCRRGRQVDCARSKTFGIHRQGGYADLLAVPRSNLFALPDEVTFAEGAVAAHSHAVVLRMIRAAGELPRDARVMVTGAGGALGTAAVQLLSALGTSVIAVASSNAKLELAGDIGASMLANRADLGSGFVEAIRGATDGEGVDVVIETTGAQEVIGDGLRLLARGGTMVLVAAQPGARVELDPLALYRNRQRVIGSSGAGRQDFVDTFTMLVDHDIRPVISATFPLAEAQAAMDSVLDRERIGKAVIDMEASG
jgi:acryloyl-coenzyme A reductase